MAQELACIMTIMSVQKLVRDRIPEIISNSTGVVPKTLTLNNVDYKNALIDKLQEECEEYCTDQNPEELADILEVVYALAKLHGLNFDQIELLRKEKATERGSFEKRIKLLL